MKRPFQERGFTLAELLVSIGVLVILVLFITQLFNSTTSTIGGQGKRTDSDAEARLVFDRLSADFTRMQRRGDVDFYGKDTSVPRNMLGNDQMAFYATVSGYYSSPTPTATPTRNNRNPVSVVSYTMSNDTSNRPQLVRLAKGLTWESTGAWPSVAHFPMQILGQWPNLFAPSTVTYTGMQDSDFTVVSESVVRFEYCYVLQPTATAPAAFSTLPYNASIPTHSIRDFYRDVAAIVVAIAVLDPSSRVIVNDYSQLISKDLFADAASTNIAPIWQSTINQPGFVSAAQIPLKAASAVRVYQRGFYFSAPTSP